jgi:phage host-nuclease inhibitor protein Gam
VDGLPALACRPIHASPKIAVLKRSTLLTFSRQNKNINKEARLSFFKEKSISVSDVELFFLNGGAVFFPNTADARDVARIL